jgi:hypothetical protein
MYLERGEAADSITMWIEYAAILFEALAVLIVIVAVVSVMARFLYRYAFQRTADGLYHQLKISLDKPCC